MKTFSCFLFCLLLVSSILRAEPPRAFDRLSAGKDTYENVTVTKIESDGIRIIHKAGMAKIRFELLSEDLQKEFNYDPHAAEKFKEESAKQSQKVSEQERVYREKNNPPELLLNESRRVLSLIGLATALRVGFRVKVIQVIDDDTAIVVEDDEGIKDRATYCLIGMKKLGKSFADGDAEFGDFVVLEDRYEYVNTQNAKKTIRKLTDRLTWSEEKQIKSYANNHAHYSAYISSQLGSIIPVLNDSLNEIKELKKAYKHESAKVLEEKIRPVVLRVNALRDAQYTLDAYKAKEP